MLDLLTVASMSLTLLFTFPVFYSLFMLCSGYVDTCFEEEEINCIWRKLEGLLSQDRISAGSSLQIV